MLGEDDAVSQQTREKIQTQINGLVEETKLKLEQGLSDGILTEGETSYIASQYIARLGEITEKVNEAQSKARLEVIRQKYTNTSLDHDTFAAMIEEMGEVNEENEEALEQSLTNAIAQIELNREYGGYETDEEYQKALSEARKNADAKRAEYLSNELSNFMSSMGDAYADVFEYLNGDELDALTQEILDRTFGDDGMRIAEQSWRNDASGNAAGMAQLISEAYMSGADKYERANLLEDLQLIEPEIEKIKELTDGMSEIPDDIAQMIELYDRLTLVAGDTGKSYEVALDTIKDSNEALEWITENGLLGAVESGFANLDDKTLSRLTESVFDVVQESGETEAERTAQSIYMSARSYFDREFEKGFDINTAVRISAEVAEDANTRKRIEEVRKAMVGVDVNLGGYTIEHNAIGNIVTHPILTTFAEDGPEAAIPINRSLRSRELWLKTGDMIGMSGSGGMNVTFSPTVNISGNADREEVVRGVEMSFESFQRMLARAEREKSRVSFAR